MTSAEDILIIDYLSRLRSLREFLRGRTLRGDGSSLKRQNNEYENILKANKTAVEEEVFRLVFDLSNMTQALVSKYHYAIDYKAGISTYDF